MKQTRFCGWWRNIQRLELRKLKDFERWQWLRRKVSVKYFSCSISLKHHAMGMRHDAGKKQKKNPYQKKIFFFTQGENCLVESHEDISSALPSIFFTFFSARQHKTLLFPLLT
jgi:hypothetical protein